MNKKRTNHYHSEHYAERSATTSTDMFRSAIYSVYNFICRFWQIGIGRVILVFLGIITALGMAKIVYETAKWIGIFIKRLIG